MTKVTVGTWGNDLAVRLPSDIVEATTIYDGEQVEIDVSDNAIVIRRTAPRITLADLFRGRTQEEWRAAYADAYDWGPDRGREIIPE